MPSPTPAKRPATKRATKKTAVVLDENRTPSEVIAAAIASDYNDLAPSVNRIMSADLGEPGRLRAITLFRESLGATDDPMRYPANAIEAGRLVDAETAPE
jgi:hypothetical protein